MSRHKIYYKILLAIFVLVIVGGGAFLYYVKNNSSSNGLENMIVVDLPFPGAVTGKQFSVIGRARGMWFFEASFPIKVLDAKGNELATSIARAQSDWMTESFVPFRAEVRIPDTYIGPATLVLKKDNPSDMREKDASLSFPITIEY